MIRCFLPNYFSGIPNCMFFKWRVSKKQRN